MVGMVGRYVFTASNLLVKFIDPDFLILVCGFPVPGLLMNK